MLSPSASVSSVESYVQDDHVYHYSVADSDLEGSSGEFQPPPPSIASASVTVPATLRARLDPHGKKWNPVHAPKRDVSGKQAALWEENAGMLAGKQTKNFIVGGLDCMAVVKRLKGCWLMDVDKTRPSKKSKKASKKGRMAIGTTSGIPTCQSERELERIAESKRIAQELGFADRERCEMWVDAILQRPWVDDEKSFTWKTTWTEVDEVDKKDAGRRAEAVLDAIRRVLQIEQSFEKLDRAEKEILDALQKEGLSMENGQQGKAKKGDSSKKNRSANETGNDLVGVAATRVQSIWRGWRSRSRLQEYTDLELAELEASLLRDPNPEVFDERDHGRLHSEAQRRAALKLKMIEHQEKLAEQEATWRKAEREKKSNALFVQLPSGLEVAQLCSRPEMGMLQQKLGGSFSIFVNKLWKILSQLRAEVTRMDPLFSLVDFEAELRQCTSYSEDGRVTVEDLHAVLAEFCPSLKKHERDFVVSFWDSNVDGLVPVTRVSETMRGSISDRRQLLCNFAFDKLFFEKHYAVVSKAGRVERLKEFYKQFAPQEITEGKPAMLHAKYKDTEKVNKELFKKLYAKYAPWLEPPEHLWSEKALRLEQERQCTVYVQDVAQLYESYLAKNDTVVTPPLRGAIERALVGLRSAVSNENGSLKMRRCDWLAFHAELSAGVPDDHHFELVVCGAATLHHADWIQFAEKKARRDIKQKQREVWMRTIAEAEAVKIGQLKDSLAPEVFEHYIHAFYDVLRKVRSSLLSVCGTSRSLAHLEKAFKANESYGDDHKLSRKDFRATLARGGIILNKEEVEILENHYDHLKSGYISVDAFLHGVREHQMRKAEKSRAAAELQSSDDLSKRKRKWLKKMASLLLPEKEKEWVQYTYKDPSGKRDRPYWYCQLTGERTWQKPRKFLHHDNQEREREIKRRASWALNAILRYRQEANTELDVQLDVLRSCLGTILPLVGGNFSRLPGTLITSVGFQKLTTIVLDDNKLSQIPLPVFELGSLRRLSIADNVIRTLPNFEPGFLSEEFLRNLTHLRLSGNKIEAIPKSLCKLAGLQVLELDNNQITKVPHSALSGLDLKVLNLSGNRIKTLPKDDMFWSNLGVTLEWLSLRNNQLASLPAGVGERLVNCTFLDLRDNRLSLLKDSFGQGLGNVLALHLQGNDLQKLPKKIGNMTNLTQLSLQHNALVDLPEEVVLLRSLRELRLNNNRLTSLPDRLGDLQQLRTLHLHCNRLSVIPVSFSHLIALEECFMQQNEIATLPPSIPVNLVTWKLHNNRVREFPASISKDCGLIVLDLAGNELEQLPLSFHQLEQLAYLRLDDNPLEPTLKGIATSAKYTTPDERKFSLLLRKLVDSMRSQQDLPGKIDTALGITVEEAMRENKFEARERLQLAKDIRLKNTVFELQKEEAEDSNQKEEVEYNRGSRTAIQQSLSTCLKRFSRAHGGDAVSISKAAFHHCIQVIGNLLTSQEVDRVTARVFAMFSTEDPDSFSETFKEETIVFDAFVASLHDALEITSGKKPAQSDKQLAVLNASELGQSVLKYQCVASAMRRYCRVRAVASKVKASRATAKAVLGQKTLPSKGQSVRDTDTMLELEDLVAKNEQLGNELDEMKKKLEIATEKAKIVREFERQDPNKKSYPSNDVPGGYIAPQLFDDGTGVLSPRPPRSSNNGADVSPKARAMESKKANLRSALREKTREIQEVSRALQHTEAVARYYDDEMAKQWKILLDKKEKKRKKALQAKKYKNMPEEERRVLREKREKEHKIKTIFVNHARQALNGHKKVLSKGDMIAAAGDFYRAFGRGRLGLEPRQWREKLLKTVNEAFSSGYRDEKTGRYIPFDKDDNGFLDVDEFKCFCVELENRIIQESQQHEPEWTHETKSNEGASPRPSSWNRQPETEVLELERQGAGAGAGGAVPSMSSSRGATCVVMIDFISANGKMIPVELRSVKETMSTLKARIAFLEALSKENQILIFKGKRLEDAMTLEQAGIVSGATVKLILIHKESQLV